VSPKAQQMAAQTLRIVQVGVVIPDTCPNKQMAARQNYLIPARCISFSIKMEQQLHEIQ